MTARNGQPSRPGLLFVYGTLMTNAAGKLGKPQRDRLQREAVSLGAATTRGRLHDLGRYPGLVASDDPADIVHGELLELTAPATSLKWLDAYEGMVPGEHEHNQYVRAVRPAKLASGETLDAFMYVYLKNIVGKPLIPGGRWTAPA